MRENMGIIRKLKINLIKKSSRIQVIFALVLVVTLLTMITVRSRLLASSSTGTLIIEHRPFAVLADSLLMNTDGWFDTAFGVQKIGIFLKNTGTAAVNEVVGVISFPPGSDIIPTSDTYTFGDIAPGASILGIFEADFSSVAPEKYEFKLTLTGNEFAEIASRKAFIASSNQLGPKTFSLTTPQGTIVTEYLSFFGGTNLESIMAPTELKLTLTPKVHFAGQFSEIPYQDPWWKPFGLGVVLGAAVNAIIDGIVEKCGGDYLDPATEKINAGVGAAGGVAAAADEKDPFRRGEENTVPLDGELTLKEEVEMMITYDTPPVAKYPFTGVVSWTFTRYTTGNTYSHSVTENFQNIHFSTQRNVTFTRGADKFVVTSSIDNTEGRLKGSSAYLSALLSRKISDQQKELITSVILHDDGTQGDAVAGDGTYTGNVSLQQIPHGTIVCDVFAQDVNDAKETDPPLVAAGKIGGLMIGHPSLGQISSPCPLSDGPEAEDGTAIKLVSFTATSSDSRGVILVWETATEIDNAGFNLYRARLKDGTYKKINDTLIPAQGSAVSGASYRYLNTPPTRGTYYYKLEDMDYNGVSTMHDPVKVRVRSEGGEARRR